jgi:acyl-CoA synthetase (AMP-forming)/AMP-acid ligase II
VRTWIAFRATDADAEVPASFRSWDEVIDGEPTEPPEPVDMEAGSAMIYTSGTTGKPKGAKRSGVDPTLMLALVAELNLLHPDGVHLTTGPLYHSGPLAFAGAALSLGHPVVVMRRFDPAAWVRLVREHRVTHTFSAPTQLKRIVSLPDDVLAEADMSSMVTLIANAAPVPYALKKELIAKLGDGFLYEVYGSTELGVDCVLKPEDQLRKPGSCGKPYGGIEILVVDELGNEAPAGSPGELFIRSTMTMDGYHRTEEQLSATEIDGGGWASVGDVAFVDDEGYVHICDRMKDMIISGGVNLYPAEIEAVLYEHSAILDAAVFGVPDDEWGESVHAVIQVKPDQELDLDDLRAHVEEHLASYKRPRTYEERDQLPRTDSGKLLKRVLREEYWRDHASRV